MKFRLDISIIQFYIRIEWRKHVLQRLAERGIKQKDILDVLLTGTIIEEYVDDKPYPSALFLGFVKSTPIHTVAAFDEKSNYVYIITAYKPSLNIF
ncbi:MAG: DUF4258 domain-containing protein [Bacteroidetes bacterium]|nr:DUF4258 domain-containing protein [Bacteroidota bacterium]